MKHIHYIILSACCFLFDVSAFAQDNTNVIEVAVNKATSVTFPAEIIDGIKVSRDVLTQRPKGIDNVLLLTAKRTKFKETNLTVFTGDRRLYQFVVRYAEQPQDFTVDAIQSNQATPATVQLASEMTKAELQRCSEKILASPVSFPQRSADKFGMTLTIRGIYIEGNVMFYHLQIANATNIPYHPEMLRLFVKDKKQSKRTASQEVQMKPVYQYGDLKVINGTSSQDIVFAVHKFTIPDAKLLNIELMEHNGGRHLKLTIKNKLIVKAQRINQ